MSASAAPFSRIVFGLGGGMTDSALLRYAAGFARLLRLDLLGLYVENRALARVGEYAAMREFSMLERQWRSVSGQDLLRDLAVSAAVAERALEEAAGLAGVPRRFQFVRANPAEALASVSSPGDIIVLGEPRISSQRLAVSFATIVESAMTRPQAVMILPNPIAQRRGPVIAVGDTDADASVAQAAMIAAALNEPLRVSRLAEFLGGTRHDLTVGGRREALIVMGRETPDGPLTIALRRRVPVLVLPLADARIR